ncbi:MAG TPA: hypothetical protein VMT45_00985, partial [Thermoanaerobaculaceae bacterium]|nr:hypothetical protein [Thermoanaerobaculaceae bacterium]
MTQFPGHADAQFPVTEDRRIVYGDPAVEGDGTPVGGQDDRIDLGGAGLDLPGYSGKPHAGVRELALLLTVYAYPPPKLAGGVLCQTFHDIEGKLRHRLGV